MSGELVRVESLSVWRRAWRGWMRFAEVLGHVNAAIILTLIYFVLVGPTSLAMRAFGWDPMQRRRKDRSSYWQARESEPVTVERLGRPF